MTPRLLLTTAVYPFAPLPQHEAATDVMGQRFTRGNGPFTMVSHTHPGALHLLAQNLLTPCVVLEYPRWRHFRREVARGYRTIGISAYPYHLDTVLAMCRYIRRHSPATEILVGSYAAQTLKAMGGLARYGDVIDDLVDEEGIAYLRRRLGEDESRPIRQRHFPKNGAGLRYLGRNPPGDTVLLYSGLGCPGGCDFCSTSALYQRQRIELLTPLGIVEHVRHYLRPGADTIAQFYLIDEDYFRYPDYLLALREHLAASPELLGRVDFVAFGSVDHIARFAAAHGWEAIAEAGIGVVFIGVEARHAGTNGYAKRSGADPRQVFAALHRVGIRTIGAWIAGFPFQSPEGLPDDLHAFIACAPTYQQLSIYSAFPGTPLHAERQQRGELPPCEFADLHFWNPASVHPDFDNRQLLAITEQGYALGYETWGPSLLRSFEVHLNGIDSCGQSSSARLRDQVQRLHRRNAARIATQLRAMEHHAPNQAVRDQVRALARRYRATVGPPTVAGEIVSWLSLVLATLFVRMGRLRRWRPKVEGFRRYRYRPGEQTDAPPYVVDRWASFDLGHLLKNGPARLLTALVRGAARLGGEREP